jgi:DNA repair protein RecO (recombination protein O)
MDGWQRAFVLHSRPWSETSLMLDVFTEESGRVRLVAKGARSRRSNLKGALQPFTPLLVRFGGRGEVKTLRSAEAVSLALPLSGITIYSGLYVNELISRVLEHETRFSELFFDYLHCIQALAGATGTPEPVLRRFELALLGHLGYGVDFLHCAGSGDEVEDTMSIAIVRKRALLPVSSSITAPLPGASSEHCMNASSRTPTPCVRQNALPELRSSRILGANL